MSSRPSFSPNWTSSPGETISDILGERGLSVSEFARRMGYSTAAIHHLLEGREALTLAVARKLQHVLGGSVEFWIARDYQYREDIARLHVTDERWLAELPVSDMIRFGWITPPPRPRDELAAVLGFFNVPTVAKWREVYSGVQEMVAFRTSQAFDSLPGAVAAWLRQGEIESARIECSPWDPGAFQGSLSSIRTLSKIRDPRVFLPKLQECCARTGVAVVVVRAPSGCRASGATRFLSADKALLLLSFRYLTDDHFWFSFFHEAGHLLLHGHDRLFLEGLEPISASEEEEANEFAARTLIPSESVPELLRLPSRARDIIRFATAVGISPGIVVGQLQHLGRLARNQQNRLKRRFQWQE